MPEHEPLPRWQVRLATVAENDLDAIIDYFLQREEFDIAADVMRDFIHAKKSLETLPLRAHYPSELTDMGIYSHREIHFRVYRIIFRAQEALGQVHVDAILDGRRDILQILAQRLLRPVSETAGGVP